MAKRNFTQAESFKKTYINFEIPNFITLYT